MPALLEEYLAEGPDRLVVRVRAHALLVGLLLLRVGLGLLRRDGSTARLGRSERPADQALELLRQLGDRPRVLRRGDGLRRADVRELDRERDAAALQPAGAVARVLGDLEVEVGREPVDAIVVLADVCVEARVLHHILDLALLLVREGRRRLLAELAAELRGLLNDR